jgi:hypothetical protein
MTLAQRWETVKRDIDRCSKTLNPLAVLHLAQAPHLTWVIGVSAL